MTKFQELLSFRRRVSLWLARRARHLVNYNDIMLTWDETDVMTVLEVLPETEEHGISHHFVVQKDRLTLDILISQYDGDVRFMLFSDGVEHPTFHMTLMDCPAIRRFKDTHKEYLEFATAQAFGDRYDGESHIPVGVRVAIKPHISIHLF